MNPDRWPQIESLFDQAIALPEGERQHFLKEATADSSLAAEVWKLVQSHDSQHPLLDAPAPFESSEGHASWSV